MQKLGFLVVLLLASQLAHASGIGFNCHFYSDSQNKYFDILAMRSDSTYSAKDIQVSYNGDTYTAQMVYNYCKQVAKPIDSCPGETSTGYVHFTDKDKKEQCFALTSSKT